MCWNIYNTDIEHYVPVVTLSTQNNTKLLEQLKSGLNVPKVTFYRLIRNLYGVELNVRLIWQIFGHRNIDILPVFFYTHVAILAAKGKEVNKLNRQQVAS